MHREMLNGDNFQYLMPFSCWGKRKWIRPVGIAAKYRTLGGKECNINNQIQKYIFVLHEIELTPSKMHSQPNLLHFKWLRNLSFSRQTLFSSFRDFKSNIKISSVYFNLPDSFAWKMCPFSYLWHWKQK